MTVTRRYGGIKAVAPRDVQSCDRPIRTGSLLWLVMVRFRVENKNNSFSPSVEEYWNYLSSAVKANCCPLDHLTLRCCWRVARHGNSVDESAVRLLATRER